MPQQQPSGPDLSGPRALGFAFTICRGLAASVEVFLHKAGSFGERYFGLQTGTALLSMLVFPAFFPDADPSPLYVFCALFVLRCLIARAATFKRCTTRSPQPHSYYNGTPSLLSAKSRISEEKFKSTTEPAFVGLLGFVLCDWNQPLGMYLVLAAVSLVVCTFVSLRQDRVRTLDMHDASVDQRRIADRWRGMRR